jgi:ABC-type multidrug transport system ATPase subunit
VRLDAIGLSVTVRKAGKPLTLLPNIHCVIEARQFVAVVGASGAGKSTLLNALTGFRKANAGTVLINGADYYANLELFRASIGYVPQDDIVHRELSVADVLRYACACACRRTPTETRSNACSTPH